MKERGERSKWMKGKVDEIGGKIVKGWLFFFFCFLFYLLFFFLKESVGKRGWFMWLKRQFFKFLKEKRG